MISIGINYSQMHDSSACISRDGEVLFAIAEERLSRVKHDARFPERSIRACLDFAGVHPAELDFVCFGWPPITTAVRHDLKCMIAGSQPLDYVSVASLFSNCTIWVLLSRSAVTKICRFLTMSAMLPLRSARIRPTPDNSAMV